MKRILVFISMLLCLTAGAFAQCPWPPHGGDNNPVPEPDPYPWPAGDLTSQGQLSYDPNEVIGPEGYDSVRWVSINDVLNYTILFENDPEFATAAAQKVDVRFDFQNKAWMKGFGIGGYSFSNMSFPVTKPSNAYQQRIDLKDSLGYYVDLIGGLDVAKQQGFWTFTTIDPETGYAPMQAERGLLPVNDSTHVGEGAVTFQLKPYEGLKTGDTISIAANIVFDTNDTIPTNRWTNKIDAGNPESKLTAETHPTLPNVYNLKFTGKDDEGGSGIRHLLLHLANHNGIYEEIDTVAVDSVLAFPVEAGKQYKLYSIAVDNTGNREPAKMEPDVILNFNAAPTDIALSDSIFQDDLAAGGFIGRLTSVDSEDEKAFTYALAEGDGAIHNDLFQIIDDQLQIKNSFKCAEDSCYKVRISTTDEGGMSFSKAFTLNLQKVLAKPEVDTLKVDICEGETFVFHNVEYSKTGLYTYTQSNDYMCDSIYVINLTISQPLEAPTVSVEGISTLVSSAAKGNQWFRENGTPVEGATEQKFTPEEDGIYYVAARNGSCYSEPSQAYLVQVSNSINLQLNLSKGWNWISSPLAENVNRDAKQFLKPIEGITERFVGQEEELFNDPVYGLTGGLSTVSPVESYKLQVSRNGSHTWSGKGLKPEVTDIGLRKGWNWLGYVPVKGNSLSSALSGLTPSVNDIIKCMDDFAIYTGSQWIGTITEMTPGEGYMYYATNPVSFRYPIERVFPVTNASRAKIGVPYYAPWSYDAHGYPDNTTLIGRLYIGNKLTYGGAYVVGAFCGDECRGIGKYVDDILFITIHGSTADHEAITFKAYENATRTECTIAESIEFNGQQEGNFTSPFALHLNTQTGIEAVVSQGYNIYPKPLRNRLYVSGETSDIKSITVLSGDGATCFSQNGYNDSGVDVSTLQPGVYIIAIISTTGKVHYEKVIKAQNKL